MLPAAAELLSILLVGRVGLALLPPGWPGGRRGAECWATLGASFLLGLGLLLAQLRIHARLGLGDAPGILLWPWLLVAGLRAATLPAPMRPRLERSPAPAAGAARGLLLASGGALGLIGASALLGLLGLPGGSRTWALGELAALLGGGQSGSAAWILGAAGFLACSALVVGVLAEAGLAPWGRALALGLCALAGLALHQGGGLGAATLMAGLALAAGALSSGWSRRADRRVLWLALGLGATAALLGPPAWAFAAAALLPLALGRIGPGILCDRGRVAELGSVALGLAATGVALALHPGLPPLAWLALAPGLLLLLGLAQAPDPGRVR